MPSILKTLRVVADPNRLRILLLLRNEELSVAELQEILVMGQSTISTHLSQLKQAGLVEDRRTGKSSLYRIAVPARKYPDLQGSIEVNALKGSGFVRDQNKTESDGPFQVAEKLDSEAGDGFNRRTSSIESTRASAPEACFSGFFPEMKPYSAASLVQDGSFLAHLLAQAAGEIPEAQPDQASMRRVLRKRQDKMRLFFDSVAGRLGKDYIPGKSWKSTAEALLRLLPPMIIADLGAGEGAFALLLAQRAKKVIAVDSSAKMIEVGRDELRRQSIDNVEYRLGDMEDVPIPDSAVDLVFFSQSLHHALHPARAIREAHRILVPGGRLVILDLAKHRFEEARELYADEWLGFSESELESMLDQAHFADLQISVVHKEPESPQFQTLLAVASKRI